MELLQQAVDIVLHLDVHLNQWAGTLGPWVYVLLVAIVFCETGLVVTPFLPGDSLLFAVGALTATEGSALELSAVIPFLCVAAIVGDAVNYAVGHHFGRRAFTIHSRFLNHEHLVRTQNFYEKHGGKTIIIARFLPIIRTFAPFVAGIGTMRYSRFALFNVTGAVLWVFVLVLAGHLVGDIPWVKRNFESVILAIIVISCIPPALEVLRARRERGKPGPVAPAAD
jgi:membrane-associated protein